MRPIQCRRYGGGGKRGRAPPLAAACAPHLGLHKILFLKHYSMTRQHTMMENESLRSNIILLRHFSRLFSKLLATNCCVT